VPVEFIETGYERAEDDEEAHTPEQVVNLLQVEVGVADGKTTTQSCEVSRRTGLIVWDWRDRRQA
jgi:hypothetical protein